jgi:hypothetical protein
MTDIAYVGCKQATWWEGHEIKWNLSMKMEQAAVEEQQGRF